MTCLLKRVSPFLLALFVGVLLGNLGGSVDLRMDSARHSSPNQDQPHSRTWLIIRSLPVPNYTIEEAHEKKVTGSMRLRALLAADGTVSKIKAVSTPLSYNLAEDAISAAKRIQFTPAIEDGKPISLWITVDYNCSDDYFGHNAVFWCDANIIEVERDWRIIRE